MTSHRKPRHQQQPAQKLSAQGLPLPGDYQRDRGQRLHQPCLSRRGQPDHAQHHPRIGGGRPVTGDAGDLDRQLRGKGGQVRADSRAWMTPEGAPLVAAARFDRSRHDGQLYANVDGAHLETWSPLLQLAGIRLEQGQGRLQAWAEVRDARIASVTGQAAREALALASTAPEAARAETGVDLLDAELQWRQMVGGWRVDVPQLNL